MHRELSEIISLTKQYAEGLKSSGVVKVDTVSKKESLKGFHLKIKNCRKCELSKTRNNLVFGEGDPKAKLVFIGEAPGFEEDRQGRPFVGRAGQLLTKIIESIKLKREEVYICNVLKCRPPGNRSPQPDEIETCLPYLIKQLDLLDSKKIICTLGLYASRSLLQVNMTMGAMRGHWYQYKCTPVMVTYHPAYLLRNPAEKRKVWIDIKKVRECLQK